MQWISLIFFFFFQAEDGIRYLTVTGVQTCALPISSLPGTLVWLVAACLLKHPLQRLPSTGQYAAGVLLGMAAGLYACAMLQLAGGKDRKSTRLNSSHSQISYAVFCLKKKKKK